LSAFTPTRGGGSHVQRLRDSLLSLLVPLLIVLLWQGLTSTTLNGVLPAPAQVVTAWEGWIFGPPGMGLNPYLGTWFANVQFSAMRVLQGFALAVTIAVPLGLLIGWNKFAARLVDPTIQGLRPIPITAWVPFSIAIFGIHDLGSIFLIFLGGFYAIVVNTTQGAREIDRNLVRAAVMMGATPWQLLIQVVLPGALPSIFTGLRIGLGISWTAVIVSEMVAVKSGLGYVLWDAYYVGRMDIVIADMASIGMMGYLSDCIVVYCQRRLLVWRILQSH
jgi:NitT/TauT family transport system permease protein